MKKLSTKISPTFIHIVFNFIILIILLSFNIYLRANFVHANGTFQVQGNQLIGPDNKPFIIKGVSSHYGTFLKHVDDGGLSDAQFNTTDRDFDKMKSLSINTVRIFVTGEYIYDEPDLNLYKSRLDTVISKARQRGFVVELANSYSRPENTISFLTYLGNTYKNDPYIFIQPLNEPNCATRPDGLTNYLSVYCEDWSHWQTEHNTFISTLRATGFTAPIIVNTPGYSADLTQLVNFPLNDTNVIFGAHRYGNNNVNFNDNKNDNNIPEIDDINNLWANLSAQYPIIIDEVGNDNGPGVLNRIEWSDGFTKFAADWVNNRGGIGTIAYTWYWGDGNTMTGYPCLDANGNADYSLCYDIEGNPNNNGILNAWGNYYYTNYLQKVPFHKNLYRFYGLISGSHFFTTNALEKDNLIKNSSNIWKYETISYEVDNYQDNGTKPVYRFYGLISGAHFYTANETEKTNLIANSSNVWRYEGTAFYVHNMPISGTRPVYRFYGLISKTHFYTSSILERNNLVDNYPNIWRAESVSYYVHF